MRLAHVRRGEPVAALVVGNPLREPVRPVAKRFPELLEHAQLPPGIIQPEQRVRSHDAQRAGPAAAHLHDAFSPQRTGTVEVSGHQRPTDRREFHPEEAVLRRFHPEIAPRRFGEGIPSAARAKVGCQPLTNPAPGHPVQVQRTDLALPVDGVDPARMHARSAEVARVANLLRGRHEPEAGIQQENLTVVDRQNPVLHGAQGIRGVAGARHAFQMRANRVGRIRGHHPEDARVAAEDHRVEPARVSVGARQVVVRPRPQHGQRRVDLRPRDAPLHANPHATLRVLEQPEDVPAVQPAPVVEPCAKAVRPVQDYQPGGARGDGQRAVAQTQRLVDPCVFQEVAAIALQRMHRAVLPLEQPVVARGDEPRAVGPGHDRNDHGAAEKRVIRGWRECVVLQPQHPPPPGRKRGVHPPPSCCTAGRRRAAPTF